ncbi:MAG: hypothetical protein ACPL7K_06875 [Armatimonadota bacterium]
MGDILAQIANFLTTLGLAPLLPIGAVVALAVWAYGRIVKSRQ